MSTNSNLKYYVTALGAALLLLGLMSEIGANVRAQLLALSSQAFGIPNEASNRAQATLAKKPADAPVFLLMLDLDGDGVETVGQTNGVHFDFDDNGFAESTDWVGRDDGLLVRHANSGAISARDLLGSYSQLGNGQRAASGFAVLGDLDSNHDGQVDANDAAFSQLRIWKDADRDATVDPGELLTLPEANVGSLKISFTQQSQGYAEEYRVLRAGSYTTTDGAERRMEDIWLNIDAVRSKALKSAEVSTEIAALPDVAGFGNVRSLHQAMAQDSSGQLQNLVSQFVQEADPANRLVLLDELIATWAGADQYDMSSRGPHIDGRKLYALEAFMADNFIQESSGQANPAPNASKHLMQAYTKLTDHLFSQLMVQTHLKALLGKAQPTWDAATEAVALDVAPLIAELQTRYAIDPAGTAILIQELGRALRVQGAYGGKLTTALHQKGDTGAQDVTYLLTTIRMPSVVGTRASDTLRSEGEAGSVLFGLAGNDTLKVPANSSGNVLSGGKGNDLLIGSANNDAYLFNLGDGVDSIHETASAEPSNNDDDRLRFGPGISPEDIHIEHLGSDLAFAHSNGKDKVIVTNALNPDTSPASTVKGRAIELIEFADGTVWHWQQLLATQGSHNDI